MTIAFIQDVLPFLYGKPITYVDVGAHTGKVLAQLLTTSLKVREAHLVEPNPKTFAQLETTAADLTEVKLVRCYNLALGARAGSVRMRDADTMTRVLRDDGQDAAAELASGAVFDVPAETLDTLSHNVLDRHISILKIDVEGSELDVLEGAADLLTNQAVDIVYIEAGMDRRNRQQCYYRDIEDRLNAHDYQLFKIYEQKNEWTSDSPVLRRVNMAFMSRRFADSRPYQLSRDLFDATESVARLEAEKAKLARQIAKLEPRAVQADEMEAKARRARKQCEAMEASLDEIKTRLALIRVRRDELKAALAETSEALDVSHKDLRAAKKRRDQAEAALAARDDAFDAALRDAERYQVMAASLVGALRRQRHEQARALAEERARVKGQFAYRLGSALTKARTLPSIFNLPRVLARQRRAFEQARLSPPELATPEPATLSVGGSLVTSQPTFARLRLQPDKSLFVSGLAIGRNPRRAPPLSALVRYVNASGRPVKADQGPSGTRTLPVSVDRRKRFALALPNPRGAAMVEIAWVAAAGEPVFVDIDTVQQPRIETAERWLTEGPPVPASPKSAKSAKGGKDEPIDPTERAQLAARRQVRHMRTRLLTLGFVDRALADFRDLIAQTKDVYLRTLAASELATWHANRFTAEDAEQTLAMLAVVEQGDIDAVWTRRVAVLRAEAQHLMGHPDQARQTLMQEMATAPHGDLYLGLTRLEETPEARLEAINQALDLHGLTRASLTSEAEGVSVYDRLHAEGAPVESPARVSIIIPVFNAEATVGTAIRSLLGQTWRDIEILVSDDCSTDNTAAVIEEFAAQDSRVRLIRGQTNAGPYVARNLALQVATGAFVTCNDSDDWSHPDKIAVQARHLLDNPQVIANTSPQARTNEDLVFHRRGNPGFYLQPNMSSLMFRREQVVERIGYWDSVRFAADSEFTRRIKAAFGKDAIVDIDCGPLMFQRQTETSLTGSQAFGYHGFKMGARREYEEGHRRFHKATPAPYVGFPLDTRPFPAPEPMQPARARDRSQRRHFDVVMVSDFRLPGGTNMSNVEEIKAQGRMGLKTGLVQMSRYDVSPDRALNDRVAEQIDTGAAEMIVYGERVSCDLLVLRLPWVLEEWQAYIPDIEAKAVRVIVNQPPQRDYGPDSSFIYRIPRCAEHLERHFGDRGVWRPIGPLVRDALTTHHAEDLAHITLGDNWHNIIDLGEWRRPLRPKRGDRIRICRHSRDQYVKWPASREDLIQIYPDSAEFEVHVLGGGETPKALLGGTLPDNWRVTDFGKVEPQAFLSKFDVFVYYTHPDWVESFGRVIFEAMAVGLPVILPHVYEPLFKDAALYAEPHEVQDRIRVLMADDAVYEAQVARATAYIEQHFGYGVHAQRLGEAMGRDLSDRVAASPLDRSELALAGDAKTLTSFSAAALDKASTAHAKGGRSAHALLTNQLVADADAAMQRGPFSVVDKTTLPPGGDGHDYWHPAPYWHPNPDTGDGLPFIRKDGVRVPGTVMYEPDSDRYDRTRLQHLFDDSTLLATAWTLTGQTAYIERAAGHLRHWFLNPATRMAPHLRFAQVKPGHSKNRGSPSGVIEMKDLYYYLDAVRMMTQAGVLSDADQAGFSAWLTDYVHWLDQSDQGRRERNAHNNHGLYYDLQVAAIAAWLDQPALMFRTLRNARDRIGHHFDPDGSQPHELTRTTTAHYCCFNFQGWANLATLAQRWNVDLWTYETADGRGLRKGAEWLMAHADAPWPYEQIDAFDAQRFIPAWHALPAAVRPARPGAVPASPYGVKPRFYPHDGIRPYWNLG